MQRVVEVAAVEKARQRVAQRLLAQRFAQPQVGQREPGCARQRLGAPGDGAALGFVDVAARREVQRRGARAVGVARAPPA